MSAKAPDRNNLSKIHLDGDHLDKINLLNYNRQQIRQYFIDMGEKPFHGDQIMKWVHQHGIADFELMTNLSNHLRQYLHDNAVIQTLEVSSQEVSKDGTVKWLMSVDANNAIETVFIPEEGRGTLCVSSQVGCALNCSFCSTARQGFNRNLSVAEIIGQVWIAVRRLSELQGKHDQKITNIVMMGMGEPLLNFKNIVTAMDIMMDDLAYGLSKYRVTLSTSGVVPAMYELAKVSDAALAVSLHAPNDELRNQLVPINKKYPIQQLMQACKNYFPKNSKRQVTMEYVMLDGVNDSPKHAKELIKILQGVPAKVNLIPFNSFPGAPYTCSSEETITNFQTILNKAKLIAIKRKTRGADIAAACGQLAGNVSDRTRRSQSYAKDEIKQ